MKASPSPREQEYASKDAGYFSSTITNSGRQRTAQACDKCRERKTKCSGEKPVCQRCTNRGLICEYSYREPRVRGPARARIIPSTSTFPTRDLPSKPYPVSIQDVGYSRPSASRRNHQPPEYSLSSNCPPNSISKNHNSVSQYLTAESGPYSEPQALHLPHWADVRRSSSRNYAGSSMGLMGFSSPQLPHISTTAREGNSSVMMYDLHSTVRQPMQRQETLLSSVPGSSSFLFEAQQSPRYNAGDPHHDYHANGYRMLECSLSSSPDGSCNSYRSGSALSTVTTPTSPFYTLDEHSPMKSHNGTMPNDYGVDTFKKPKVYTEDVTTGPIPDFSYIKDFGMREDWCVDSDTNKLFSMGDGVHDGGRSDYGALWSTDVPQVSQVELGVRCQNSFN